MKTQLHDLIYAASAQLDMLSHVQLGRLQVHLNQNAPGPPNALPPAAGDSIGHSPSGSTAFDTNSEFASSEGLPSSEIQSEEGFSTPIGHKRKQAGELVEEEPAHKNIQLDFEAERPKFGFAPAGGEN